MSRCCQSQKDGYLPSKLHSLTQFLTGKLMLSKSLGFPRGKRVTDHHSILAPETVDFSQGLLPPLAQRQC